MKANIVIGLVVTIFLCSVHFLLANGYHYLTSVYEPESFFDFDTWSYPFKRSVYFFNFATAFFGIAVTSIICLCKYSSQNTK